jgi:hypothetical protein
MLAKHGRCLRTLTRAAIPSAGRGLSGGSFDEAQGQGLMVPAAIVIIPVFGMMARANLIDTYLA